MKFYPALFIPAICLIVSVVDHTSAEGILDEIQSSEEQLAAFQVHPDLEVNLFASEPWIPNPIAMHFDPEGKLWVICSPTYPHVTPGVEPDDRLVVLEDQDRDGVAEKGTVFADKLYVPTGFALGDGGAYVANQPDLLFIQDKDGDGYGESRKIVLSGFGTEDNHHAISAWVWGPDGGIYFQSGIFLHTQVETPYGVTRLQQGAILRFEPRKLKLDPYAVCGSFANPWGHAFDRWGQNFLTEAPGGHIYPLACAIGSVEVQGDYPRIQGAPKSCGIEFVSGAHWPEDWQGDLILNAFKNKIVCRYKFSDDSSSFTAKELDPLIVSTEEAFRPVDVKMGPDGAIYVLDWYNPIIGHMQYNFRDPRRDHTHGRVWRITHKGRPLLEPARFVGVPVEKLLDRLKDDFAFNREKARRVIYDTSAEVVVPALEKWVKNLDPTEPEFEHHRLEALWTYQTIDVFNQELLDTVLASPDYRARAAAARVFRHWLDRIEDPLPTLERLVRDEHPRVRLEAVVALSFIQDPRAMEIASLALLKPMDRHIEFGLRNTARALEPSWLPALEKGEITFGGDTQRLSFVLQALDSKGIVKPLLSLLKSGDVSRERREHVVTLVAGLGGEEDLEELLHGAGEFDAELQAHVLSELREAATHRGIAPKVDSKPLRALLHHPRLAAEAVRLAGAWKVEEARVEIEGIADDSARSLEIRQAALAALGDLGGEASASYLEAFCAASDSNDLKAAAVAGLASVDLDRAAALGAKVLIDAEPNAETPQTIFPAFLQRSGGGEAFSKALAKASEDHAIPEDTAKLSLRYLYSIGHQDPALLSLLTQASGVAEAKKELSPEEMQALIAEVQANGDPARGELLFRRADLSCMKCHSIVGAGGQVAPDLAGLGASSQMDYLVESILLPSKAVREGYAAQMIDTVEGDSYHGTLLRETENEVVLRDQIEDEILIPKADIGERRDTGSLMPQGIADLLTREELVDLVRFVSELGKPGAYETRNLPVVRRWRSVLSEEMAAPGIPEIVEVPLYSLVSGDLPLEGLPTDDFNRTQVRCEIEVTTPGKILFKFNNTDGLRMWIDNEEIEPKPELVAELERGNHSVLFQIKLDKRKAPLRLEVTEAPESAGRVQVVSGR